MSNNSNDKSTLNFQTFIGQSDTVKQIHVLTKASKIHNNALPHMLFLGPGGLGKTTLANVIAKETNRHILTSLAENIKNSKDLFEIFVFLFKTADGKKTHNNPILFIDEIHGLNKKAQEALYTAMEDLVFDHPTIKNQQIILRPFTLIGATTNVEKLQKPFLSRFVKSFEFKHYSKEESQMIAKNNIKKMFKKESANFTEQELNIVAEAIARRTKGIARNINNYVKLFYDYFATEKKRASFTKEFVKESFDVWKIDENGLQDIDYRLLKRLYQYRPEPIGGKHLASLLHYDISYIEEYIEPWLLELGAIDRTKRGRKITESGIQLLQEADQINKEQGKSISIMDF